MTTIPIFQLDAFTDKPFGGNPAAVCPLQEWLPDEVMQSIALENNVSETAFYVPEGDGFRLRWFTPKIEVDLCGHATLATAWLILNEFELDRADVAFETRSGTLTVSRDGDLLAMDFPAMMAE
jgi:PhzF family phenazine biosynthesis protein